MSLDTLVAVTITKETASLKQASFGTVGIAAYHTHWTERSRKYSAEGGLAAMVTDGFLTTDPAYLAAQSLLSQNPRLSEFKILRRALAPVYTLQLTPVNTTQGFVYSFSVIAPDGTVTAISYTVPGSATVATIVTALTALIDAITGVNAADNATHVTITVTGTGALGSVVSTHRYSDLTLENLTADPGIATDLAAIELEDPDWYGLLLDSAGRAETEAAAAWCEAQTKLFGATTSDTEVKSAAVTDDVASTLQDNAYARCFLLFHENDFDYAAAAWMGGQFPYQAGTTTWKFKTLAGVVVSPLKADEISAIEGKGANCYYEVAGRNITSEGWTPSGEFIDVTHGIDEMTARIQEGVFLLLVTAKKVPFTRRGIAMVLARIQGVLDARADPAIGFLAEDPAPLVTGPAPADVPQADRAARKLPDVNFSATLAGAIHSVVVAGKVAV